MKKILLLISLSVLSLFATDPIYRSLTNVHYPITVEFPVGSHYLFNSDYNRTYAYNIPVAFTFTATPYDNYKFGKIDFTRDTGFHQFNCVLYYRKSDGSYFSGSDLIEHVVNFASCPGHQEYNFDTQLCVV